MDTLCRETDVALSDWLTGHSLGRPQRRRWAARSACFGRLWVWRTTSAPTPSCWPCTRTPASPVAGTRSGSFDGACKRPLSSHRSLLCSCSSSFYSDSSRQVCLWKQTRPFCLSPLWADIPLVDSNTTVTLSLRSAEFQSWFAVVHPCHLNIIWSWTWKWWCQIGVVILSLWVYSLKS